MRKLALHTIAFVGAVICSFDSSHAQIQFEADQTVEWYVENVLLGAGVSATNITFNGMPATDVNLQCGYFQSNGDYIDLESGLVLSTGHVIGEDFNGDSIHIGMQGTMTVDNPTDGDPDLEDIAGQAINDVAILEFDFVPTGDTLRFNYIFGSEEYPEYVNTSFNDAFGFFLSGPGITGPYSAPAAFPGGSVNIALVTGTTTPVAIGNVNNGQFNCGGGAPPGPCVNCDFYVNNCDSSATELDGLTTVFEAFSLVECGETYHIKLAIGDAADGALDSGVFLQEGSFESSLAISAGLFSSIGPDLDGILYENCGFGVLTFTRQAGIDQESLVELELTGTGINGVDFSTIPDSFLFEEGDSVMTMNVSAIIDNIPEGLEDVTLTITNTAVSACANNIQSEFTFFISDDPEPVVINSIDYAIDCGESAILDIDVSGGYGQYNYFWSDGAGNVQDPMVSPGMTTDYVVLVTDTCNSVDAIDTITVEVPVYPPVVAEVVDIVNLICLEVITIIPDAVSGGNGVYTYEWYENGSLVGTDFSLLYQGSQSSSLEFVAIDECGNQAIEDIDVIVPEVPLLVQASGDTTICAYSEVQLNVDVSGGEPPYQYAWSQPGQYGDTLVISPDESTEYIVTVTDLCDNVVGDNVVIRVAEPDAFFSMVPFGYYGIETSNFSTTTNSDTLYYNWDFGDGAVSNEEEPKHVFQDLNDNDVWLYIENELGCRDSMQLTTTPPSSIYVPTSFSPNGDGLNDHFYVVSNELVDYELFIFDRWGREMFFSNDPDEKWNGRAAQSSEYFGQNQVFLYRLRARDNRGQRFDMSGTITMVR